MGVETLSAVRRASRRLEVASARSVDFIDITDRIASVVSGAEVVCGVVVVQTLHTTTGLLVNEAEPLLLEDLRGRLASWAPMDLPYGHDDLSRRTVNLFSDRERRNGHAHCRAALLRTSETLVIDDGRMQLGRWQRLFLVDCDGPQRRSLLVQVVPAL